MQNWFHSWYSMYPQKAVKFCPQTFRQVCKLPALYGKFRKFWENEQKIAKLWTRSPLNCRTKVEEHHRIKSNPKECLDIGKE